MKGRVWRHPSRWGGLLLWLWLLPLCCMAETDGGEKGGALSGLSAARVAEELRRTHETVLDVTGVRMTNLRPPYGAFNDRVRKVAFDGHGYDTIMWSVDPLDWKYRNSGRVTRELVSGAAPGAVLLCHDIHPTTIAAIPPTLDQLLARGFAFVTIDRLMSMDKSGRQDLNLRPPGPKPGALPS